MKKLNVEEELNFVKEIIDDSKSSKILEHLRESFNVIQVRAQMLLSLIALCLTITGFSGPKIAASNNFSKISISLGLFFVFISALILISGPLRLNWVTQYKASDFESTVHSLLERRNNRTKRYRLAALFLVLGLFFYVCSVITYLLFP